MRRNSNATPRVPAPGPQVMTPLSGQVLTPGSQVAVPTQQVVQPHALFAYDPSIHRYVDPQYGRPLQGQSVVAVNEWLQDLYRQTRGMSAYDAAAILADQIVGPIHDVAAYESWTGPFFQQNVADPMNIIRVVLDEYSAFAVSSSPAGQPVYNTIYGRQLDMIEWSAIVAGIAIPWTEIRLAGWNILERRMQETSWEIQKKLDKENQAVLDAAIAAVTGHNPLVGGGKLTKSGVDDVIRQSIRVGFPVEFAAINPARVLDMTDWEWEGSNSIWFGFQQKTEELFTRLWVNGYGGLNWTISNGVPYDSVYFSGNAMYGGWHWMTAVEEISFQDFDHRLDKYSYMVEHASYYSNPFNLWRVDIW